jgi:predicted nucleic acid-binding protein
LFANRFTALVDACALAGALKRNLLLSLAEAEFFRLRWSSPILDETERAIADILAGKGDAAAAAHAARARAFMEVAFEEAMVSDFEIFMGVCGDLPDPDDAHVVAAALKTQAKVIVTDNLKDFPVDLMAAVNLDVRSSDAFIADAVALDHGKAVAAIRRMRERLKKPAKTPDLLLRDMEAAGLTETADTLRPFTASL